MSRSPSSSRRGALAAAAALTATALATVPLSAVPAQAAPAPQQPTRAAAPVQGAPVQGAHPAARARTAVHRVAVPGAAARRKPVAVRLISFNDLHGNLQPPGGSSGRVTLADGSTVDAGGLAYLAAHVDQLRSRAKHSLLLSTGDNIGASPLVSAAFHDEPTIEALNAMGVQASVVGNHEFDEGYTELLRMQFGGCNPTDGCRFEPTYSGATFPFLGANVTRSNGAAALLPFTVKRTGGVNIGIIGVTLKDLPSVVTPTAITGLTFGDEVKSINRTATMLDQLGVKAQVVLLHQGDESLGGGPQSCATDQGAATTIARAATSKVDVFFTGHTHQQYRCFVRDPAGHRRPVIQGLSFGRLLSVVDVKIDRRTKDVIRARTTARNVVVTRTVTPDAEVAAIVARADRLSASVANRKVGSITADLTAAATSPTGESTLGDVIADAQLEATRVNDAQVAITNPGGIRADLTYAASGSNGAGVVTYGEAFAVQPFSNILQTITLTGAQLDAVLEQQWQPSGPRILQISSTLHYTQTLSNAVGNRVSAITVAGKPVTPTGTYRVTVNNFLAAGGDGFTVFAQGTDLAGGPIDLDAFVAYLTTHSPITPPATDRITLG